MYPVSTDSVAPLETVFATMATSVQDALDDVNADIATLGEDTGWQTLTVKPGYAFRAGITTPLHHVRRLNNTIFLRLHMDFTVGSWSGSAVNFATIPLGFRPDYEVRWMGFRTSYSSSPVGGYITDAGEMIFQESNSPVTPGTHFSVLANPWIKA